MKKEALVGIFAQIILVILAVIVMALGGRYFFTVSFGFFFLAGIAEFIFANNFKGKAHLKPKTKDGILWVHGVAEYIKRYNTTIYNFKKLGPSQSFLAYLIMFIYIVVALFLYKHFDHSTYFVYLIYLIPILSNLYYFLRNNYKIED